MAGPPVQPKTSELGEKIWAWLTTGTHLNGLEDIFKWILIFTVVIAGLLWILGQFLEKLAKALEAYKKSGLPVTFSHKKRIQVQRRKQFCTVLRSDLATLAKAENWNDQYFTDLEAEIEAEGGYYATVLHRIFKRRSRGLRRVSSLIQAIESSTEPAILLVGNPGSGKSVALRHLAYQLAERGIRSSDPDAKIPLYVNLKELMVYRRSDLNADFIKQFVLDNIRRGDGDTAAYVRENWDDYRERGIWVFLFDSFDEIPEVLHAPTGSPIIRQYTEAIRQFLEGMSSCQSLLASREFKGPDALPWQKFRILPLSDERQDQLVNNSFLMPEQKEIVSQHLAISSSSLKDNPLFLTLLCRYVKDENHPPANDHDLLSGHIDRLATREPDYIKRKYRLLPANLISGSVQIAALFAEHSTLSLAPTQDEIAAALANKSVPGGSLENLLAALVDVKIGRSDVQEARAGDRRFTFSHRRYQETLFVRYLVENSSYLPAYNLLTDLRWREYTVTLLQTQGPTIIEPLLKEASRLLTEYAAHKQPTSIIQEFGGHLNYYIWEDDPAVLLLLLLQEGLAHRLADVPVTLVTEVDRLLEPRWQNGDLYDRTMVIHLGGLLPQTTLQEYLAFAVNVGTSLMQGLAFQRTIFLTGMPENLAIWVRERLSHEILRAKRRVELLRLEALSARLPTSIGSNFVLHRCYLLRNLLCLFSPINKLMTVYMSFIPFIIGFLTKRSNSYTLGAQILLVQFSPITIPLLSLIPTLILAVILYKSPFTWISPKQLIVLICLAATHCIVILALGSLYAVRSVGRRLDIIYLLELMNRKDLVNAAKHYIYVLIASTIIFASFVLPGVFINLIAWVLGRTLPTVDSYLLSGFGAFMAIATIGVGIVFWKERHWMSRLHALRRTILGPSLFLQAESIDELEVWFNKDNSLLKIDVAQRRSLARLLSSQPIYQTGHPVFSAPLFKSTWTKNASLSRVVTLLWYHGRVTE